MDAGGGDHGPANDRWRAALADWEIPREIIAKAPASPHGFDPAVFTAAADEALARAEDSPSDAAARDALPAGGSVLDVGSGAGAGSLRLADRASTIVAVDQSAALLQAFVERAGWRGADCAVIEGVWPEVAAGTPTADVVVCHHVIYNVPDLASFAAALTTHARQRVVVELTAEHPMRWTAPYWQALHGLERPTRPTVDDAVAVLDELGLVVCRRAWSRSFDPVGDVGPDTIDRLARRVCLPPERHGELRDLVAREPPPPTRQVATLWWAGAGA
jgi:SAM-dependent methyltransferase